MFNLTIFLFVSKRMIEKKMEIQIPKMENGCLTGRNEMWIEKRDTWIMYVPMLIIRQRVDYNGSDAMVSIEKERDKKTTMTQCLNKETQRNR